MSVIGKVTLTFAFPPAGRAGCTTRWCAVVVVDGREADVRGVEARRRVRAAGGVWVAGVDAGGIANGGYASGLAQALVLGLVAAESVYACR